MLFGSNLNIIEIILRIPALLLAFSVHECAHGYVAMKLGDPTARNLGRLTLNPLKHLDPFGTICMVLFGFGWAKPVPINARYFKKPRRDMALTAVAGPLSNLILAFLGVFIYCFALYAATDLIPPSSEYMIKVWTLTLNFLSIFIVLNVSLAVFNLLPVPPLDGSRFFYVFLPPKWYFGVMKYERYIYLVVMLLVWTGIISRILTPVMNLLINIMFRIVEVIPVFR